MIDLTAQYHKSFEISLEMIKLVYYGEVLKHIKENVEIIKKTSLASPHER